MDEKTRPRSGLPSPGGLRDFPCASGTYLANVKRGHARSVKTERFNRVWLKKIDFFFLLDRYLITQRRRR